MLSRRIAWGACLSLLLAAPAIAGEIKLGSKAVLELFTSQGCASSPKADAVLDEMSRRPDIVVLAYHVDYWDYIGWQDTFGSPANSQRQRDYAEAWDSSRIFTPQLVVNGQGGLVGSKRDKVDAALEGASLPLGIELVETGENMLSVTVPPKDGLPGAVVWLVTFIDRAEVKIDSGLNEGKTLPYGQIVTGRQVLGVWDPKAGAKLTLPLSEVLTGGSNGAVILVQEERDSLPGPILGAASFTL